MDELKSFTQIIDEYINNYSNFQIFDKVIYECDYGELGFIKNNDKCLTLYAIYIYPTYREKGICREIFQYIIDNANSNEQFRCFKVESVISNILYDYLVRFEYKNKKFIKTKKGFTYLLHH